MSQLNSQRTYLYLLYNEIIYDPLCNNYYNILTLNKQPQGPLQNYTKLINITIPSTSQNYNKQCTIAIINTLLNANNNANKYNNLLLLEDLNDFTEFLINNNYIIDNSITKIYINNSYINVNSKKLIYSFKITL